jgi:8-oxo-dGTP pyrophosphatase MutT (NUDIX family)
VPDGRAGGFAKLDEVELASGYRFSLVRARFRAPDGQEFSREVVRHPGAVGVVPLHDDGTVTLVRQYRPALETELLEIPAGLRDVEGEADERTAHRELEEEAGLRADRLELLTVFRNSPGLTNESVAVYAARDLTEIPDDRQGVEEQSMTVERLPLVDALTMVDRGEITDAKTIIGLTLVDRRAP